MALGRADPISVKDEHGLAHKCHGSDPKVESSSPSTRNFLLAEQDSSAREWFLAVEGSPLCWKGPTLCGIEPLNPTHSVKGEVE